MKRAGNNWLSFFKLTRRLAPDEGLRCKCDRLDAARDYRRLHRRLSLVDVRLDAVARIPDRRSHSPRQGPIHSVHVGWLLVGGEAMKSAMMGATLRWGLASVLVTGLLLVSGAGPGAGEQPLMRDLELEALREAVRWPDPDVITVIALTGRFVAARQDQEALAYFEERAKSAPDRPLFVALEGFFQARVADDVFLLRRVAWVNDAVAKLDRAVAQEAGLPRYFRGLVLAELPARFGKAAAAVDDLQWVLDNKDPLEIVDGRSGFPEAGRQLGEHEPAEVARQARLLGDGPVELGDGVVHPRDPTEQEDVIGHAGLEKSLERDEQRPVGRTLRPLLEVRKGLLVLPGRDEPSGEGDDGDHVRIRPADRLSKRLELEVAHERLLAGPGPGSTHQEKSGHEYRGESPPKRRSHHRALHGFSSNEQPTNMNGMDRALTRRMRSSIRDSGDSVQPNINQ